jgi:DNA-binding response OmpR family regulator
MSKKKILVVDDEKETVDLLKKYLESQAYDVISAYDGKQALEKIKEKPDLIILDIIMPDMNGFEVLHDLRSKVETRYIPVVIFSARSESDSILKAEDLGTTDYVIKPFKLEELLNLIKKYIK